MGEPVIFDLIFNVSRDVGLAHHIVKQFGPPLSIQGLVQEDHSFLSFAENKRSAAVRFLSREAPRVWFETRYHFVKHSGDGSDTTYPRHMELPLNAARFPA